MTIREDMQIAIVGGGLAGCAAAYELKSRGHECVIYEAGDALASGASGNSIGLYNPRFGAEWSPQSQYYATSFERALAVFPTLSGIDFEPCGALHLMTDEKKARRFGKMIESWEAAIDMRIVDAAEASEIAGIEVLQDALYLPHSGSVNPSKLCAVYAQGVEVRLNARVDDLALIDADVVVLAAGAALKNYIDTKHIDLKTVRGQVTVLRANKQSENINCHLCYGGYASKAIDGRHMVGATFQRWLDHDDLMDEDDADNLGKLYAAVPAFPQDLEMQGAWAAVRCASKDHFPVVGHLRDGVYVSSAHGSHGILSALMAAEILANTIENKPQGLSKDVIAALSPYRFKD